MFKFSKTKFVLAVSLFGLFYFLWPIYATFAHKSKVPFPPFFSFEPIPNESPQSQNLSDAKYAVAGNRAIELITQHKQKINAPAISAAVAVDGKLVWAGASGWADIDDQIPATPDSQFRIGSTSKALTGAGLARLMDQQQIDLDSPIENYLVDLPEPWRTMTARQLASHTAGLPHYKNNSDYLGLYQTLTLSNRYDNVNDALAVFDGADLLFKPGTNFSYSSFGTVLLSAVMQGAAKLDYLKLMQQQVFSPLKMTATKAEFELTDNDNLATFYWNDQGRSEQVRPWRDVDLSHRLAGGGFISTSSDLVKLGIAMLNREFISEQTLETVWTPQVLPNGIATEMGYSIGWRVITFKINDEIGEIKVANHAGVSRGAQSWLMVLPGYNMALAVNINSNTKVYWDFGKISMQLAELFITTKQDEV